MLRYCVNRQTACHGVQSGVFTDAIGLTSNTRELAQFEISPLIPLRLDANAG